MTKTNTDLLGFVFGTFGKNLVKHGGNIADAATATALDVSSGVAATAAGEDGLSGIEEEKTDESVADAAAVETTGEEVK